MNEEAKNQIESLMRDLDHDLYICDDDDIVGYLVQMLQVADPTLRVTSSYKGDQGGGQ